MEVNNSELQKTVGLLLYVWVTMHFKTLYTITLLYRVCPDLLRMVGETSYRIWVGFIESDIVFTISLLLIYSYLRCKV